MATIKAENLGNLHEKVDILLTKDDYQPAFKKALKDYGKKINMPGFRKGQVPPSLIKKMYGESVFSEEIIRIVEKELEEYIQKEKPNIFAQPLPLAPNFERFDMEQENDYTFSFEIGLKSEFTMPDFAKIKTTKYKVDIDDKEVEDEIEHWRKHFATDKHEETIGSENYKINFTLVETDKDGKDIENGINRKAAYTLDDFSASFQKKLAGKKVGDVVPIKLPTDVEKDKLRTVLQQISITEEDVSKEKKYLNATVDHIHSYELPEVNEEFFKKAFPDKEIKTLEEFKEEIRGMIAKSFDQAAENLVTNQIHKSLIDNTAIDFPEAFLKKWMKTQNKEEKSEEQIEKEFPSFIKSLKWNLLSSKISQDNNILVEQEDLRNYAKQQFGMGFNTAEEPEWLGQYINQLMSDQKFVERAYLTIIADKVYGWLKTQVPTTEKNIDKKEFLKIIDEKKDEE